MPAVHQLRNLTPFVLKRFNSSLKSEFIVAPALPSVIVDDEFPGGAEARRGILSLPEKEVERPVQVFHLPHAFHHNARRRLLNKYALAFSRHSLISPQVVIRERFSCIVAKCS